MGDLLLIDAKEDLQPLARALERAGFRIRNCALAEAHDALASGPDVDAALLDLTSEPSPAAAIDQLDRSDAVPKRAAVLAVVLRQQADALDPSLPIDDFILHSAPPEEGVARVRRAIWHKSGAEGGQVLHRGDLLIDQASYKVFIAGHPVELTFKEYELLRFLALNPGTVCTRERLLSQVWGYDFYGGARTVDVHIRRLRSKIEDAGHTFIETVRNVGYRFRTE
jgi:DNA-binding response OmpR family regulator